MATFCRLLVHPDQRTKSPNSNARGQDVSRNPRVGKQHLAIIRSSPTTLRNTKWRATHAIRFRQQTLTRFEQARRPFLMSPIILNILRASGVIGSSSSPGLSLSSVRCATPTHRRATVQGIRFRIRLKYSMPRKKVRARLQNLVSAFRTTSTSTSLASTNRTTAPSFLFHSGKTSPLSLNPKPRRLILRAAGSAIRHTSLKVSRMTST